MFKLQLDFLKNQTFTTLFRNIVSHKYSVTLHLPHYAVLHIVCKMTSRITAYQICIGSVFNFYFYPLSPNLISLLSFNTNLKEIEMFSIADKPRKDWWPDPPEIKLPELGIVVIPSFSCLLFCFIFKFGHV